MQPGAVESFLPALEPALLQVGGRMWLWRTGGVTGRVWLRPVLPLVHSLLQSVAAWSCLTTGSWGNGHYYIPASFKSFFPARIIILGHYYIPASFKILFCKNSTTSSPMAVYAKNSKKDAATDVLLLHQLLPQIEGARVCSPCF